MIHKLLLTLLFSLPIFADFFPKTVYTKVITTSTNKIQLQKPFPKKGMSGVIIHPYGKTVTAITHRIVQQNKNDALLLKTSLITHDKIPTINTTIKRGDKVIGGYLYKNVLLLAPDEKTYKHIINIHNKNWVHPDLFSVYLSGIGETEVTRENLHDFAKKYQVGLVYVIRKNSAILLDPLSQAIISKKTMKHLPQNGSYPFYTRLDNLNTSWFNFSKKKRDYYLMMEQL